MAVSHHFVPKEHHHHHHRHHILSLLPPKLHLLWWKAPQRIQQNFTTSYKLESILLLTTSLLAEKRKLWTIKGLIIVHKPVGIHRIPLYLEKCLEGEKLISLVLEITFNPEAHMKPRVNETHSHNFVVKEQYKK